MFLAQLHRRALLLNSGFQERILEIVSRHSAASTPSVPMARRSESMQSRSELLQSKSEPLQPVSEEGASATPVLPPSASLVLGSESATRRRSAQLRWASDLDFRVWTSSTDDQSESASRRGSHVPGSNFEMETGGSLRSADVWSDVAVISFLCDFDDGVSIVEVHPAPIKT